MGKTEKLLKVKDYHNVVVIGGGIAGLQASSHLVKNGMKDFVLLEGSQRLGGRIKSMRVGSTNAIVEMGANWVQAVDENPVYVLARDNNLMPTNLKNKGLERKVLFTLENGEPVHPRIVGEVDLLFGQLMSECESFYRDNIPIPYENDSVGDYIEREFEDRITCHQEENKEIRRMVLTHRLDGECLITGAPSMKKLSLSEAGCFEDLPGRHSVIPKGFESVIDVLQKSIPGENIHLNSIVTRVSWDLPEEEYPIKVETSDGQTYYCKMCLVTSSLGYLKQHATHLFEPKLPPFKLDAIDALKMGVVNKLVLFFEGPLFPDGITRLEMIWSRDEGEEKKVQDNWFRRIPSLDSIIDDIAICWLAGKEAEYVETLSDGELCDTLTKVFQGFLSKVVTKMPAVTKVLRSNWGSNPLILGSYMHIPVGTSASSINDLARPVCNSKNQEVLFFAGEATHPTFYTSSHGAMLTGLREADNMLQHLPAHETLNGVL